MTAYGQLDTRFWNLGRMTLELRLQREDGGQAMGGDRFPYGGCEEKGPEMELDSRNRGWEE